MTEPELNRIEQELNVALPDTLKEWLRKLPPPGSETNRWQWLFNDVEEIIEANQRLRRKGCYEQPWPHHLFCLNDVDGNYTFLDTTDPSAGVFYTNHDAGPYYQANDYSSCYYTDYDDFFKESGPGQNCGV